MTTQPVAPTRVVVLARPELARQVESILHEAGHEVYRTPDASGIATLIGRVRPHLVIIACDIPWADGPESPLHVASRLHQVPVLLIGDARHIGSHAAIPQVPSPIDQDTLHVMVARLLNRPAMQHVD